MYKEQRSAFTMVELIFVIIVIGILSAIAIPKLAATRDDAIITVAINTVSSVRNSLATERKKRTLRGDFGNITDLNAGPSTVEMFTGFNADKAGNINPVLEYAIRLGTATEGWTGTGLKYTFANAGRTCAAQLNNSRFVAVTTPTTGLCRELGF